MTVRLLAAVCGFALAAPAPLLLAGCQADAPANPATPDAVPPAEAADSSEVIVGGGLPARADAMPVSDVIAQADRLHESRVVVEGTVRQVCQTKGCWLRLDTPAGETFRVNVEKDAEGAYAFTFPKDASGTQARLAGWFERTEDSVETLRHLAQDAGVDSVGVAAITEPRASFQLTATGGRLVRV